MAEEPRSLRGSDICHVGRIQRLIAATTAGPHGSAQTLLRREYDNIDVTGCSEKVIFRTPQAAQRGRAREKSPLRQYPATVAALDCSDLLQMSLPASLRDCLRLPAVGAPLFIISNPDLVLAQCKGGIVGSFPALNARPPELLD